METDRNKIIEKLKTVKDPAERDRLMWALSGLEKESGNTALHSRPPEQVPMDTSPETEPKIPPLPAGFRGVFAYFVPGLFILFGISNLLGALTYILSHGEAKGVIRQLVMGSIFLVFGIISLKKAKKRLRQPDQETDSGKI